MDSGNSGSLQSSSGGGGGGGGGGDEVFDSRTESISSFLNPSTHFNPNPIHQPPHHQQPPSTFFDPTSVSTFSQSLNPNPNPMYNLDSLWSRNVRPDSSYTNFESTHQDPYLNPTPVDDNTNRVSGTEQIGVTTKNPKKRTRASRRAPTTVLTTDTTNFRQMVQEFTGIPAAPFSASSTSSPFSRRLDLYGGGVAPLHPLRPSAQKIQLQQQQQPSYLNSTTATTSNFQLPPSDSSGFSKQPLNLSNLQNPMFPFQSLSQTTLGQQMNVTESDNQRSEPPNAFPSSSSKRWRGQDDNLMNFEGGNGNNNQDAVVSSRSDGDQLTGNEDSWIN
ncbi:hypothetical protein L6452_38522 [Arctium lappa]|uniref:Uncharacterized protein n=1 Tax=Arctium lappa TaxID=4217 RepID=A0ACB8XPZ3_ARCLA|nr:hypothetical protein L6452_38522 [Arctium lappa]